MKEILSPVSVNITNIHSTQIPWEEFIVYYELIKNPPDTKNGENIPFRNFRQVNDTIVGLI